VSLLAATITVPDGLVPGIALAALLLVGILGGCLLDMLPGRAFYSRRAFEPPPRIWGELDDDWELERPPPGYRLDRPRHVLSHARRRELES
jgi:hypothetical protein